MKKKGPTNEAMRGMLWALQPGTLPRPKHVYAGTVPARVRTRRRAANRVARRQRRINRLT